VRYQIFYITLQSSAVAEKHTYNAVVKFDTY